MKKLFNALIASLLKFFGYTAQETPMQCVVAVIYSSNSDTIQPTVKVIDVMPGAIKRGLLATFYDLRHMDVGTAIYLLREGKFNCDAAYICSGTEKDARYKELCCKLSESSKPIIEDY